MTKQLDIVEMDIAKHVAKVKEIWAEKEAAKKKLLEDKSSKPKTKK